jgi:DNA invertase Pin-like site-specific DNA recombinase
MPLPFGPSPSAPKLCSLRPRASRVPAQLCPLEAARRFPRNLTGRPHAAGLRMWAVQDGLQTTVYSYLSILYKWATDRKKDRFLARRPLPGPSAGPSGRFLGYARVSTEDQATDAQTDELSAAGCQIIYQEHGSGASRARPELARLMREIRAGDVLIVVRLDRLARSVSHLLDVIERLEVHGAHFRSLRDPIDTSTPQGMFSLQVLGAVAQLERALISERTKAGIKAARARGKLPGNPGLRARDPTAIRKVVAARDRVFTGDVIASMDRWLPTVRRMRPQYPWEDVVRVLAGADGAHWSVERLRRAVRRAVRERLAEPKLLDRTPRRPPEDRLMMLAAGIAMANPQMPLRAIGAQLEAMRERTPRGGRQWAASSVKNLLDQAERLGLALTLPDRAG